MEIIYSVTDKIEIGSTIAQKQVSMQFLESHDFYEIYYLVEGKRKYFIDNAIYQVDEGDVIIVPPNVLHRSIGDGKDIYSRVLIAVPASAFKDELLLNFKKEMNGYIIKIPPKRRKFIENLLEKTEYEYTRKDGYSEYLINCYINELLVLLMRMNKGTELMPSGIATDRIISKAAHYISQNFEKPITLDDVADEVNMSKTYFCKLFKKKTGFGFSDYLAGVRITEAARLLTGTDLDVTEIALKCGYSDSSYFAAVFKKVKGMTPVKYRKSSEI